ncbi:uncharacterized protein BO66DRAFT_473135 [Aspergillus aculeatinus CBS 121060]|uniref:Uncharacterized protein n=1 Tax=Aspergillus aculeatinus CBS 121060 TaxID=1448322 RepID=A0ACD1H218_9EURO|nr:hypothetical protein BO66DRAFT_473135 [Aspergillus aculeatinus CBS 121060]RAH67786.1 hypothetical protein BO66DRAFT_473135 [Aspergillus aculeatinus CBS 121060]
MPGSRLLQPHSDSLESTIFNAIIKYHLLDPSFAGNDRPGSQDVNRAIATLQKRLQQRGNVSQYVSFKHVSAEDFSFLEESRDQLRGARSVFTSFRDFETLIIEVPTIKTEIGNRGFDQIISIQLATSTGIRFSEFMPWGRRSGLATPCHRKRSLGFVCPAASRHIMVGSAIQGVQVLLILPLEVSRVERTITIEKYFPQRRDIPDARAASPNFIPELISTTAVKSGSSPPSVQGAIVVLEFSRVIGRQPVPSEQDVILPPAVLIEIGIGIFLDRHWSFLV